MDKTFAEYILEEKDFTKKMEIMFYLQKKAKIFFDKSVMFKTELAKLFIETMHIDVDENFVITACLLCNCKKPQGIYDPEKMKNYTLEGAKYIKTLGFSNKFCKICAEFNRYYVGQTREKESDILELVEHFGGMLLDRPERTGIKAEDAIVLLEYRNLKGKNNMYLEEFKKFVDIMQEVYV